MNMIVYQLSFLVIATLASVCGNYVSLAQSVFLPSDPSVNPFSDRFVQRVINMDREQLKSIPQLEDEQLLYQLVQKDDNFGGLLSRSDPDDDDDKYEAIFDDKLDDQLSSQDSIDSEWVELMTAGPLAVNYVGNLLVLAGKRDFPLSRPSHFNFQYIQNPNSFRATLSQVSGALYSALIGAHTAMDRVQLNVEQIPDHVKTALKLVLAGTPSLIQFMLPKTMQAIGRIANESAALAQATHKKFLSLQEMIAEIIEANTNTHSNQMNVVQNIQNQINEAKKLQAQIDSQANSVRQQYEDARKQVEKARQEYQAAVTAIPTARLRIRRFFRKIVNTVVQVVVAPANILGCILGLCYTNQAALNAAAQAAETAKQNAIAKANQLRQVLQEAERRQEALAQQQAAEQKKLVEIINRIAALDLNRLSEQEIVDILIEAIMQLNQIKEQWARLIQFFSKLAVQAESTQQIIIYEFLVAIQDAQQANILLKPSDRELFTEVLSIISQEIERGAHLLYIMSRTYYDVSSEYMINQIISMNNLLLLPTDVERSAYLKTIATNTTATSAKIIQLAEARQKEYILKNRERRAEYERFLAEIEEEELQMIIG